MSTSAPAAPACPDCQAPLSGGDSCGACGLPLLGPTAGRLWQVDQQLLALDGQRTALLGERAWLIDLLRKGEVGTAAAPTPYPTVVPYQPHQPRETSPKQVQNTLLGLGALLLGLAGIVFAAVTYQHLGVVGRALVLLVLTAVAAVVPVTLARRTLTASAEAVTAVALVLSVVDAWALRRAGLGDGVDVRTYGAVATAVLAALAAAHALVVPLKTSRLGALALAQLPVAFLLARSEATLPAIAVTVTALAALDLALAVEERISGELRVLAAVLGIGGLVVALGTSTTAVSQHDQNGAWGLLALASVTAFVAYRVQDAVSAALAAGSTVALVAGAAWAVARPELTHAQRPLVVIAVALLALQVSGLLPRGRREGPVLGALAVAVVALGQVAEPVLLAVAGPFTWLGEAWTLTAHDARDAVSTQTHWEGSVVTLVVLVGAAGSALAAGALLDRLDAAAVPSGVLLVLTSLVLPLGLATSYDVALVLLLSVGAALTGGGVAVRARQQALGLSLVTTGVAAALLACVWSVADQTATLTVLPATAVLTAGVALVLPGGFTALTALLLGAELAAVGAQQGLAVDQVGGLLLAGPATCVALSWLLHGRHRLGLEAAGVALSVVSVTLAVEDPGWLSWTLAGVGLLCLAVSLRTDRRVVGLIGGLLLSASSWVRLADARVHAPEPYVAPLAIAALLFGYLRRREQPSLGSFGAYGAGLSVALVPSLLKAIDDTSPTRGLLLLVVAGGVVLLGAKDRLRAPLVIGGAVLAVDALNLLSPYASALPRWTLLAGAGTILVVLGATYEQRLRDVQRLRATYEAWS